jgi:hypothetical protein
MTSVARELDAEAVDMRAVADAVVRAFGRTFGLTPRSVDRASIDTVAGSELDTVHTSPR